MVFRKSYYTGEKPCVCEAEDCNMKFRTQHDLKTQQLLTRHTYMHTGERPYKCTYESCDKAYTKGDDLATHIRCRHTGEKPYPCPYCHRRFSNPKCRKIHLRSAQHNNQEPGHALMIPRDIQMEQDEIVTSKWSGDGGKIKRRWDGTVVP